MIAFSGSKTNNTPKPKVTMKAVGVIWISDTERDRNAKILMEGFHKKLTHKYRPSNCLI